MTNNYVKITEYAPESTRVSREEIHVFDATDPEDCDRVAKIAMARKWGDVSCFRAFRGMPVIGVGGGF